MTILEAVSSYSGRMGRSEYWLKGMLPIAFAGGIAAAPLAAAFGVPLLFERGWFLTLMLVVLWFQVPLLVKRLHDRNHSLWYGLILLIPVIGNLWLFIELGFLRGTIGNNRFGEDPRQPQKPDHACASPNASMAKTSSIVLVLFNAVLIVCLALVLAVAFPAAIEVYKDYLGFNRTLPGLVVLLLQLGKSISHFTLAGVLLGCALWWNVRFFCACLHGKTRALWWIFGIALLLHVILSAVYIPAISLNRSHTQPGQEANQPSEGTR